MRYFRSTFLLLTAILCGCLGGFASSVWWIGELRGALQRASCDCDSDRRDALAAAAEARLHEAQARAHREFVRAWEPYLRPAPAKELGNYLRNGLTTLATGAALTSEGATVASDVKPYHVGDATLHVQQVSLSVVGDSLPAVVAWLGAAEQKFAYGRIESLTLTAYASRSVQLGITLLYPVDESATKPVAPNGVNVSKL